MPRSDPWASIGPDTLPGTLHARRVDPTHPHDFFWGRDAQGHRLFIYQLAGTSIARELPRLRGIAVEAASGSLILRLIQHSDIEMFSTLCWSIIERTRQLPVASDVLGAILSHLERWQRFLARDERSLLSDEQIRGLFCELMFLEQELVTRFGSSTIQFWRGPNGNPQDFAVGTTLFEIKSHVAGGAPVLMISSADQLWHSTGDLFVVAYTIGETSESSSGARSLAALVSTLRATITQSSMAELFEDRLLQAGYVDLPEYAQIFYVVSEPEIFRVTEDFPRITKESIRAGICRLKYGIELSACMRFRAKVDWNSLGGTNGH